MKLLTAFGLLAVTLAASWQQNYGLPDVYNGPERSFEKGKTYVFQYYGQIVNGVPTKGASSHSIQQATAKVYLTIGDKYWTTNAEEIKITQGQRRIEEPRSFEKLSSLEEAEITAEQMEILRLPVRFRFHQGIITEVHFSERDNVWSENMKRSFLNMLQVQLTPKNQQEFPNTNDKDRENKYFTQPERILEGECEVGYTIVEGEKRDEKEVTKAVNFDKCSKRVDLRYGFRYSSECESCEEQDTRPESQTVLNYKIKGDEKNFLIKEVSVKSEYVFSPLAKNQEMLATYIHNIVRLIKVEDAKRIEEPRWSTKKSSVMYNFERELAREQFWMTGDEESWKKTGFAEMPKKEMTVKFIENMLAAMEESQKEGVKLESTHEMVRLVISLRMCNREEMTDIHRAVCESDKYDEDQKKIVNEIMADALAVAGTKVTIEHLIEKIEKKQISPIKAALTLKSLINARVSSEKIVELLLRLSKSKVAREEPTLRQSAMLTAGAMMNVLCGRNTEMWASEIDGERKCTREQKMTWLSTFKTMYSETSDKYEKVLVLKTLANAGLDVSVHFLEDLIQLKSEEPILRSAAIDALRMIREEMPKKIQSVLLPVFKSRREPVSLRMSAVYQILHSRPSLSVLEQIVDTINREPHHQLRSFCYSLLRSFVESENPCEKKIANDVTIALRSLRFRPTLESRHFHSSLYSRVMDLGLSADFASIITNESMVPKELLASFDALFGGEWSKHLVQVGFSQQNLDTILIPLLNKLEKVESESITRGMRSQKPMLGETLKELVQQMKIASRRSDNNGEPFGMLYIRYKNLDYAVVPIEETIIDKITRQGFSSAQELIRDLARGQRFNVAIGSFIYERNRLIVTSSGIPLLITQKMPTVARIEGHIKVEFSSSQPALRIKAEPSVASTHVTEMQLLIPIVQTGARVFHSVQATLPIDCQVEYNWERQQLKAIFRPPKEEKRVLIFETRPVSFVRTFSKNHFPTASEKTITLPRLERSAVHYEHEFGERLTGIKAEVFGSVHRHMFDTEEKLESLLYGENHVQFTIIPTERAVKELVFEIEPKWNSEKTGLESPRYNEGFEDNEFRMEDSEEENEWEPENKRSSRHQETRKYYSEKLSRSNGMEGRIVMKAYTVGGPKPLKAELNLMGECHKDGKSCRVEINGKRSPMSEEETNDWTLECKAQIVLPESPKSIRELREQKHREIQATVELLWGSRRANKLTFKIQAEQDREMQKLVRDIIVQSEESKKERISQIEILKEAARLNKITVLVNHDLEKKNEKVFEHLYSLVKANYYIQSEVEPISRSSKTLVVRLTVDPEECRRVNLTVETSDERMVLPSVLSPIRLPLPTIAKTSRFPSSLNIYDKVNEVLSKEATCEVRSNKVTTFDDLTYKAPMTTCYAVLAKDCSESPEYAVMMKTVKRNSEEKKIKIVTNNKEFEIEMKDEQLVCKINGREADEETLNDNGIEMIGDRTMEIRLRKITVRFDGYMCEIKADKRTQNKQCGMCGHFDGLRDNEFRRADDLETDDIEDFHRSWLKKDNECEIEEPKLKEKKNYGFESFEESAEYESNEDYDRVKKVKKTHKKTNYRDEDEETYEPENKVIMFEKESKTCFSVQEEPSCRQGDEVVETTSKKVKVACLSRSDRKAREIVRMIKNDEDCSREIKKIEMTSYEHIRVPTLCRVY